MSPPPRPPPPSSLRANRWAPYSSEKDFNAAMATVVVILIVALVFSLCLTAAVRFLHRLYRRYRPKQLPNKEVSLADALPSLVFSPGTKLAGAGAECAICLAEFTEGDRVKVLPACNHGFHMGCVEKWLSYKSSCPTCRQSCRPAAAPAPVEV